MCLYVAPTLEFNKTKIYIKQNLSNTKGALDSTNSTIQCVDASRLLIDLKDFKEKE